MVDRHQASHDDLSTIKRIEDTVEGEDAASIQTLQSRMNMFPEGFRVAKLKDDVVGYIESYIWNMDSFETFDEIRNFTSYHTLDGDITYVIYLCVDPQDRRKSIGSHLVQDIIDRSIENNKKAVHLVATHDHTIEMYEKLGFVKKRYLQEFLPSEDGWMMEYMI